MLRPQSLKPLHLILQQRVLRHSLQHRLLIPSISRSYIRQGRVLSHPFFVLSKLQTLQSFYLRVDENLIEHQLVQVSLSAGVVI